MADKRFGASTQAQDATLPPRSEGDDFLAECDVYKETAKSDLVVVRRTRLYQDSFVTFHNFQKDPNDKKSWFLDRKCELVPASESELGAPVTKAIRPVGTWTIVAAVQKPEAEVPVFSFSLEWPATWAPAGYTSFVFGFSTLELARTWHKLLHQRITALGQETPVHRRGRSGGMASDFLARMSGPLTSSLDSPVAKATSGGASPLRRISPSGVSGADRGSAAGASDLHLLASSASAGRDGSPALPGAAKPPLAPSQSQAQATVHASAASAGSLPPAASLGSAGRSGGIPPIEEADSDDDTDGLQERSRQAQRNRQQKSIFNKRWVPVRQTNGVAVYYHTNADDSVEAGGEYMVSAIVRGTPKECLDVLVSPGSNTSILGPARTVEVLTPKTHDSDKEVLRMVLDSPGGAGSYLAQREVVVERIVRTDTEGHGLYVILFSSCAPPPGTQLASRSRMSWFRRPVLGTVRGGYTIAPLEAHKLVSSPESLVSFIVKVDMGGVCSESSWLYPVAQYWGWTDSLLDRVLMSVNLVRDEVEQARFAIQPFMFETNEAEEAAVAAAAEQADSAFIDAAGGGGSASTGRNVSMTGGKGLMRLSATRVNSRRLPSQQSAIALEALGEGSPKGAAKAAEAAAVAKEEYDEPVPGTGTLDLEKMKSLATLDTKFWDLLHTPGKASPYSVRGPTYLKDKKKIPAGEPQFQLSAVDLVAVDAPVEHIARFLPSVRQGGAPFSIVFHLVIPGSPVLGLVLVMSHPTHPKFLGTPPQHPMEEEHQWSPFDFVLHKYVNGTDEVRNSMLKLIPHIADGSWMIKSSVGTVPVIIGKALKTRYTLTKTYLEVDIDITANHVANYVTGLVRGATTSLVIDFGLVLEGTTPWELPEFLLGAMRLWHLDVKTAKKLDMSAEIPLVDPGSCPPPQPPAPAAADA